MNKLFIYSLVSLLLTSNVFASGNKTKDLHNSARSLPVSGLNKLLEKSADDLQVNLARIENLQTVAIDNLPLETMQQVEKAGTNCTIKKVLKATLDNETVYFVAIENEDEMLVIRLK